MNLYRITSDFFCAGLITTPSGRCCQSAPILKRWRGQRFDHFKYSRSTGYKVELVCKFIPPRSQGASHGVTA
jgi:hypothetical protein